MLPTDLFRSTTDDTKLHPQFKSLRDSPIHGSVRQYMNELYSEFGNPEGSFLETFQRSGFHSRVFELACFAYLKSAGCSIDRSYAQPDFLVSKNGSEVAIESVTANSSLGQGEDISLMRMEVFSPSKLLEKVGAEFPKRINSVIRKKINLRYDRKSQCIGKPFVLMVAPFFEAGSVFYPDEALIPNFYPVIEFPTPECARPCPIFEMESASAISAVLYCNAFTVPSFFRIATDFNIQSDITAYRCGAHYRDVESHYEVREFCYEVGSAEAPSENWGQGVTVFLNPNAKIQLPDKILPASSVFSMEGNVITRKTNGFHPVSSMTFICKK